MDVFITGGAGYVGRAVTRTLAEAGHRVIALVRREPQAHLVRSLGATPLSGDLRDPRSYAHAARACEVIVHLAVPDGPDRDAAGRAAVDALLESTRSSRVQHLIYTSVLFVLGHVAEGADEETLPSGSIYAGRATLEREILAAANGRLTTAVIRPGMVYGGGAGGSVSEMFRSAAEGTVCFVGDGANRWTLVHRDDVASLFRLAVQERAGGILHATDDAPLRVSSIAQEVAAAAGGVPVAPVALADAREFLGVFADALCLDQPVRSTHSRALGWSPAWAPFPASAAAAFAEFTAETKEGSHS